LISVRNVRGPTFSLRMRQYADAIFFDDKVPGFGIRQRAGGSQTWVFQYKIGSMQQRLVLGKASAMKPEAARKIAERHHAAVKDGRNPAVERNTRTAQAANTFGNLVHQYLEFKQGMLRPRSLVEVRRHLDVNAKPLHRLPVVAIDKTLVAHRIKDIAKNNGVVTANRMRACLSALFTWAMKETDFVETNPVINTHKAGQEKPRDRVLENVELKIIWNALADDEYGTIVKLLVLTGQRRNEIAGLRWSEIDFERDRIALPADRTKNKQAHHVPMSNSVRQLLEARRSKRVDGQEFVFARRDLHARKVALDKRIFETTGAALPHWTPHDLRRTCATRMAEDLQIQPHVIEAILNHVSGHKSGVGGIYNLASYTAEKSRALALWADHVMALVEGRESNVTPLRRA
jgi:integrase